MASYYWVGGNGTWDNSSKTNWATVSGGAGGNGPPTNADLVFFDANSGTAATVTVAATAVSTNATVNKSDIVLSLSGSPTLCTGTLTFTSGTITLNNNTLTTGAFSSDNSNARTINFGTGNITITGSGGVIWNFSTPTNFSFTGTPVVNCTYSGSVGTRSIRHGTTTGGTEANSVSFNISAGTDIILFTNSATNSQRNVNFTGFKGTLSNSTWYCYGDLTLDSGMTVQAGVNAINFNATSGTQKITTNGVTIDCPINRNAVGGTLQLQDNLTMGSTRAFTLTAGTLDLTGNSGNWTLSAGSFVSSNTNTRAITFGTGNITVTGNNATVWDNRTATNFSYTGTSNVRFTYAGATGNRLIYSGSVSASGTENNSLSMYFTAGTDLIALASSSRFNTFDTTGFSGTLQNNGCTFYGDFIVSAGLTWQPIVTSNFFSATTGTKYITTNGKLLDGFIFNGAGSTWVFQDALTQTAGRAFTITAGTVKLKSNVTTTVGVFSTSGTTQKYLQSTVAGSQATLSQSSGTVGVSYLTIQDIYATGGATWNAFYENNNVDAGNNTNWNFGGTPSYDAEYGYKLRSFTERGRF